MKQAFAVIMAGGIGSRFWPMSTAANPKQFHDVLGSGETLLQQTYRRVSRVCPVDNILIVTSLQYVDLVTEQLPELPIQNILAEPSRRNTAPCLAYATAKIQNRMPDALMLVTPSDSIVTKEDEYERVVRKALLAANEGEKLITLGIRPHRPDTGYGYIQFTDHHLDGHPEIHQVKTFTEKPDLETAKAFLASGDFLWNAGIFIWSVSSIIKAMDSFMPELTEAFFVNTSAYDTVKEIQFIDEIYASCASESIDYGIMEKAKNVYVLPSDFGWSDLGTWGSLYEHSILDENDNAVLANKTLLYNSANNMIRIGKNKVAVVEGLNGYIVVNEDNRLLICKKDNEQLIKNFVNDLRIQLNEE